MWCEIMSVLFITYNNVMSINDTFVVPSSVMNWTKDILIFPYIYIIGQIIFLVFPYTILFGYSENFVVTCTDKMMKIYTKYFLHLCDGE